MLLLLRFLRFLRSFQNPKKRDFLRFFAVFHTFSRTNPAANRPRTALAALDYCATLPNLSIVLQLLATFPITTAEAERCFSKMERTLTTIRSPVEEESFDFEALLLLQVHREDTPSVDAVLDHFAATSARLKFVLLQC